MKPLRFATQVLLSATLLIAGCASKVTTPEQYSGFFNDYSQLRPASSATGQPVMRWTAPDLDLSSYRYLLVESIAFHPQPSPTEQISSKTLSELEKYLSTRVKGAFSKRFQVHDLSSVNPSSLPAGQTLILRGAITGVSSQTEPLKAYEVIPIALVTAAAMSASGKRDQQTELFIEAELLDARTGQPVLQVVRKGYGKTLENKQEQITMATLKNVVDDLVRDIEQFK